MQSTNSTARATLRWTRHVPAIALLVAGVALALPGQAKSGRGHHGWGGPDGWIERHAEELGIDDATLVEINQIIAASREEAEAIYEEHRQARDVMHEMLEQDEPDTGAVMKQADVIGEIDIRKHKHRLATMLKIRAKLTPEQRSELRAMKDEMHERHGKHHRCGEGCPGEGCRGEDRRGDGPPAEDF